MLTDTHSDSDLKERSKIIKILRKIEELFFILILLTIVLCGLLPIGLRFFYSTGMTWTEPLSRQLVLWLALFGAGAAVAENKHIAIDVLGHFLLPRLQAVLTAFIALISTMVCAIMTWISCKFIKAEVHYAYPSLISDKIPEWYFELVLPIGFFLLTFRLLLFAINTFIKCIRKSE
jgi:TRAP-type C4-dicarboxylate transport system permease small subunit